jgi:hypothetical protein
MTESEWQSCTDPQAMLDFLFKSGKPSERKLRLFAVACCRRFSHLFTDEGSRQAVDVAERYADGGSSETELESARQSAMATFAEVLSRAGKGDPVAMIAYATARAATAAAWLKPLSSPLTLPSAWVGSHAATVWLPIGEAWHFGPADEIRKSMAMAECRSNLADLFRDIFRNPSSAPLAIDPACVLALAQRVYDERAFDRMPELADALEEADCGDREILDHCRSAGQHARGCWVVDLILAKQ